MSTSLRFRIDRHVKLRRFVQENRFTLDIAEPFHLIAGILYSGTRQNQLFVQHSIIPGLDAALGGGAVPGDSSFTTGRARSASREE